MKRFSKIVIAGLVIGAVVLGGCTQKPQLSPDEMVSQALSKSYLVKAHQMDLTLTGDAASTPSAVNPGNFKFDLNAKGGLDMLDAKNPKFSLIMALGGSSNEFTKRIGGVLDVRLVDKLLYLNVTEIPDLTGIAPPEALEAFKLFKNKWLKFPTDEQMLSQLSRSAADESTMTPQEKQMMEVVKNAKLFKDIAYKGNENIHGMDSAHYVMTLDSAGLKDMVAKLSALQGEMSETEKADFDKFFSSEVMGKMTATVDMWISVKDMMITRMSAVINVGPIEELQSMNMNLDIQVWDFNKPVNVEIPPNAETFDPLMLMGGGAPSSATVTP